MPWASRMSKTCRTTWPRRWTRCINIARMRKWHTIATGRERVFAGQHDRRLDADPEPVGAGFLCLRLSRNNLHCRRTGGQQHGFVSHADPGPDELHYDVHRLPRLDWLRCHCDREQKRRNGQSGPDERHQCRHMNMATENEMRICCTKTRDRPPVIRHIMPLK